MPKNIDMYDLLISCPGDITSEIDIIDKVVNEFNACNNELNVRTRHWSKDAYAQSGGKPQNLLNKQFVNDCDMAVVLFWTRFGTPTDKYDSGTEEEIENMISAGKQVFLYFSEKKVDLSIFDQKQYCKVNAFREKYQSRGLFFTYKSDDDFERLFRIHLSKYFQDLKDKAVDQQIHGLSLKGICNEEIKEYALVEKFDLHEISNIDEKINKITELFHKILNYQIDKRNLQKNKYFFPNYRKVIVPDDKKELILEIAEYLKIELNEDFFELGTLEENVLNSFYNRYLIGSDEEKEKFNDIEQLYNMINDLFDWCEIENCYSEMKAIKLCLVNQGQMCDDIDIELYIPNEMLLTHDNFKVPGKEAYFKLEINNSLYALFGIKETRLYQNYEDTCRPNNQQIFPDISDFTDDYKKSYQNDLNDIFCYKIQKKEDMYIVTLHVDHINQSSNVAFPTPLFLKELKAYSDIQYKIILKNNTNIKGKIEVKNNNE